MTTDSLGSELSGWARFALGGLVAGLVAWGGIAGRIQALEVRLTDADTRAADDRELLRQTVQDLNGEIRQLSHELTAEREERLRSQVRVPRDSSGTRPPLFEPH